MRDPESLHRRVGRAGLQQDRVEDSGGGLRCLNRGVREAVSA